MKSNQIQMVFDSQHCVLRSVSAQKEFYDHVRRPETECVPYYIAKNGEYVLFTNRRIRFPLEQIEALASKMREMRK